MSGGLFGAPLPEAVSIDRQIASAKRELGFRERVYARRVSEGKMRQAQADEEIACQRAIIATLQRVKEGAR